MWDFDEKAFDQFIRKRFNLEKKDDLKKNEKEENIDHLNEAALSEAISESLNENSTKEDVRREENRNIDTYTYDYPTISSINISPSKYSIFSDKPREQLKTDTTSKLSIKESTWSSGALKESSVKASETKIQLPNFQSGVKTNSNNMRSSSSNMLNNPSSQTRSSDGRFSSKYETSNIVIGSKTTTSTLGSTSTSTLGSKTTSSTLNGETRQQTVPVPWNKPNIASSVNQNPISLAKPEQLQTNRLQQQTGQIGSSKPSNIEDTSQNLISLTKQSQNSNLLVKQNQNSMANQNSISMAKQSQNLISMAKPTSVITRSNAPTLDSRSPGASQPTKVNMGAKKTIDLTSNSGGKPEVSLFLPTFFSFDSRPGDRLGWG